MAGSDTFYNSIKEDYPMGWNKEEFTQIHTFTDKLRYALTRLPKIASGSGRSVFKIDDTKVLKIAKNKKGLAQNAVESEKFLQNYDIVAKTFDSGEDVRNVGPFWVEMELAKRVAPSRFKQLTGVTLDELSNYFRIVRAMSKPNPFFSKTEEVLAFRAKMEENEFVNELMSLIADYEFVTGDFARASTYGEVLRDGKPAVVLVDFGLTKRVYDDYYKVNFT